MDKIRIVVVDDSPFSVALISSILEQNGFEVVGSASNLEEVKEVVADTKPSLVTMDMTLPGTDGLECTRAVHEIDEKIKVIMVSSMMDDAIVKDAKKNNISAYVQKPIDPDELVTAINIVMSSEELFQFLKEEHLPIFKEALMDCLNRMTKTIVTYVDEYPCDKEYEAEGITILIGIIGIFSGRMLLDISKETAAKLATATLKRAPKSNDEMTALLGELVNIISGNACSIMNVKNKALGLRVAPPSILQGDHVLISPPNFTTTTVIAETAFGKILLNVGFDRGEDRWM